MNYVGKQLNSVNHTLLSLQSMFNLSFSQSKKNYKIRLRVHTKLYQFNVQQMEMCSLFWATLSTTVFASQIVVCEITDKYIRNTVNSRGSTCRNVVIPSFCHVKFLDSDRKYLGLTWTSIRCIHVSDIKYKVCRWSRSKFTA